MYSTQRTKIFPWSAPLWGPRRMVEYLYKAVVHDYFTSSLQHV